MLIEDTYRHKGLRNRMVDDLIKKGITDLKVQEALRKVPRHQFFQDQIFIQKAYEDIAFQIGEGQTISHPSTVGLQTQWFLSFWALTLQLPTTLRSLLLA